MKKIISLVLIASMILAISACDSTDETKRTRRDDETHSGQKIDSDSITVTEASDKPVTTVNADFDPDFTFSVTDRDGNTWDESVFSSYNLTMINFWEPWCGPCVGEIPDLEKLYEDYKDMGFQIIGVYSETAMEGEVDQIIRDSGVTYPILHYSSEFDKFQTGYVPTTIFVDGEGHILTVQGEDSVVGSKTYNDWAKIIEKLL
ncbi:MAG: TlpA family protein disulfide reductase [Clostridiales bacterium]|nr:TlpA family protein disulfide reductase [Clostridiales bacterium]